MSEDQVVLRTLFVTHLSHCLVKLFKRSSGSLFEDIKRFSKFTKQVRVSSLVSPMEKHIHIHLLNEQLLNYNTYDKYVDYSHFDQQSKGFLIVNTILHHTSLSNHECFISISRTAGFKIDVEIHLLPNLLLWEGEQIHLCH